MPPNLKVSVAYDTTCFIRAPIDEVVKILDEVVLIVIVVVFLFLGVFHSAPVPVVTTPPSMIDVLFFIQTTGYSINLSTLLVMVLAIGLVVDGTVVVAENVHHYTEESKPPFEAAPGGARGIAVLVVNMTIILIVIYAPVSFLADLTDALSREFASTPVDAVVTSGIVALILSPMMCSRLLRHEESSSGLAHHLDLIFEGLKRCYQYALHGTLDIRPMALVFTVLVLALIPVLLMLTKKELASEEGQGTVFPMTDSPQIVNLGYLNRYTAEFEGTFRSFPEYCSAFRINGHNGIQAGIGGMLLKPRDKRGRNQMELFHAVQTKLNEIPGVQIFAFNLPSLLGTGEGLPLQFVPNTANDYGSLLRVVQRMKQRASESGKFAFLDPDLTFDKPELMVDIDREKAMQMDVSMQDLGVVPTSLLGGGEINRFIVDGRSYKVTAQVKRPYRDNPGWLGSCYVKSRNGQLVVLSTLIETCERARPWQLSQFQQLSSAIISGSPTVSMGEVIKTAQQIVREEVPRNSVVDYAGTSRQYVQEGSALLVTFGLALMTISLVLAVQFESFRDPLVTMVTVSLSICGAPMPLFLGVSNLNVYTQVGLATLIGLISKHGILIVEFANQLHHEQGLEHREAIEQTAAIHLRPALIATAVMVLGVIPLILATGVGAVSRSDVDIVVATGMLVGTLFTLFILSCIYTLMARPGAPPDVTQTTNAH